MANMIEVQMAFKNGDKAKAAQLLKTVLHQHPTADAWVMAARLTSNPETAKMHLQRALAYEPKHIKARDMLRDLGGVPMSTSEALTGGLLPVIRAELEKFGANKPILKNLSPSQRMFTALGLYVVVIAVLLTLVSTLLAPPVEIPLPPNTVFPVYQGETLINQWTTEGLNLSKIENIAQTPQALPKEALTFALTDDAGSHEVTVFLYADIAGIVNDRHHLTALIADGKNKIDFIQTAVIIYPADMNKATVSLLESVFNPAPPEST